MCHAHRKVRPCLAFFFFNDTATTEIYTLSLHDALPISALLPLRARWPAARSPPPDPVDRKSTRLNSSHPSISYAVFCLKKKNKGGAWKEILGAALKGAPIGAISGFV